MISTVRIVGAGLIGTSIGLCLKSAGIKVEMMDLDSIIEAIESKSEMIRRKI